MLLDRCKFCFGNVLKTDCLTIDSKILIHGSGFNPSQIVIQAAYEGKFPEHDAWGEPLTGDRARMAGQPLCGGPWALTQFRTALQNCCPLQNIQMVYLYIYIHIYRCISLCDIEAPCMEYLPYLHLVNYLGSM